MDYGQLNDLTKKFLVSEGGTSNTPVRAYLMALKESLGRMKPSTTRDKGNLSLAMDHLKEVRRGIRRLEEDIKLLQEQVKILEESKGSEIINEK